MIVVTIIGILASVAIPNYQKFQSRARQSEAKVALSGIATTEKAYSVEVNSYSLCLNDIGYIPDNIKRYYMIGFQAAVTGASCGPAGLAATCLYTWDPNIVQTATSGVACQPLAATSPYFSSYPSPYVQYLATNSAGGVVAVNGNLPTTAFTRTSFTAGAGGQISSNSTLYDQWTLTDQGQLANVTPGL